jgi:hypothetical protein
MLDDDGEVGGLLEERLRRLELQSEISIDVERALHRVVRRAQRQRAVVRVTALAVVALVGVTVVALLVRPAPAVPPPADRQPTHYPPAHVTPTATAASVDFVIGGWQTYVGPVLAHGRYSWLLGDWSMDLDHGGAARLVGPPEVGTVNGRWTMRGDHLRLDVSGRLHCSSPGVYKVEVPRTGAHTFLPLTVISDPCVARQRILVNGWVPL